MNRKFCIALDVGGTSIKSAIVCDEGYIVDGSRKDTPINAKGSSNEIIQTFVDLFQALFKFGDTQNLPISGIGIGFPGPFDYENGISLIKDLDKYEAIYGMNLKNEFRKQLKLDNDLPIVFENDGWTFTRGEAWQGTAKGFNRVIGLTLGTGLGSGFYVDDDMVDSGTGVPPTGWFSGLQYKDGIIDDFISKRAIKANYRKLKNDTYENIGVKEIAERAKKGEKVAQKTFQDIGALLGKLLRFTVLEFKPECIVIGGKMALSYDLFTPNLMKELQGIDFLKKITKAQHIEIGGILGAGRLLFKKKNDLG